MSISIRFRVLALTLLLLPTVPAAGATALFESVSESDVAALLTAEESAIEDEWALIALRRSYVWFDPAPLYGQVFGGIPVELNLFPDTIFTATLNLAHDARRLGWVGSLDGVAASRATFFLSRALTGEGAYAAVFREPESTYRLRKVGRGADTSDLYAVEQVDFDALPQLDDPPDGPGGRSSSTPFSPVPGHSGSGAISVALPQQTPESTSRIDVLYLYTPGAAESSGAIESLIYQIEDDSNSILGNSEVDADFRVVGIHELDFEFGPTETTDLALLAMDSEVQALRDGLAADLVQLIVELPWGLPDICGIGHVNFDMTPGRIYSISRLGCESRYTPVHELGHTLGTHHAPGDSSSTMGYKAFCKGYKDPDDPNTPFRTVMASTAGCPDGCVRIPHFSSSTVLYFNRATGNVNQDNHRCLNLATPIATDFRVVPVEYQLDVTVDGSGSVQSDPAGIDCPSDCSEPFIAGTEVELWPTGDPGWSFAGWFGDGDCNGDDTPLTFTLRADMACEATFELIGSDPVLTLTKSGTGTGTVTSSPSGIDCDTGCPQDTAPFATGTPVQLAENEGPGSNFAGWSGDCASDGSVVMDGPKTCTATFNAVGSDPVLTLTKSGTGAGTVTSSPSGINCDAECPGDSAPFATGTPVQLAASEGPSSNFAGWSGDCASDGSVVMNGNKSCTATFESTTVHTLTVDVSNIGGSSGQVVSVQPGISCEPDCTEDYADGTVVTLIAQPEEDFLGWSDLGGCPSTPGSNSVTLTMDQPRHCLARFRDTSG